MRRPPVQGLVPAPVPVPGPVPGPVPVPGLVPVAQVWFVPRAPWTPCSPRAPRLPLLLGTAKRRRRRLRHRLCHCQRRACHLCRPCKRYPLDHHPRLCRLLCTSETAPPRRSLLHPQSLALAQPPPRPLRLRRQLPQCRTRQLPSLWPSSPAASRHAHPHRWRQAMLQRCERRHSHVSGIWSSLIIVLLQSKRAEETFAGSSHVCVFGVAVCELCNGVAKDE